MTDDDIGLEAKRVFGDTAGATTAYVATGAGLARVEVSGDVVGEFTLADRRPASDVTAHEGRVAVATNEDVLIGTSDDVESTGFGPADAVGVGDGLLAAGDGRLARYHEDGWSTLARIEAVRGIDGSLLATADGVYRDDGTHVGLEAVTDVAAAGPLAATGSGLYYLANGWMAALDTAVDVVTAGPDVAHAAGRTLYEGDAGREWRRVEYPVAAPVVDLAYGPATYAVTADGTFLVDAGDGWRHRSLGLSDVAGVAVP
jgi:hypothetical protein